MEQKYFVNRGCGYTPKMPYQTYVWSQICEKEVITEAEIYAICREAERKVVRGKGCEPSRMHVWLRSRHNKPIIPMGGKPEPVNKPAPVGEVGTVPLKLWPSTKPRVRVPRDEDRVKPTKDLTVADKLDLVISILADIERKM